MLILTPAVFAVGNEYQIMYYTDGPSFGAVKIGNRCFYDESNGVLCCTRNFHRIPYLRRCWIRLVHIPYATTRS